MVSVLCNSTVAPRIPNLPRSINPIPLRPPPLLRRCSSHRPITAAAAAGAASDPPNRRPDRLRTLFPGGFKRPEIKVPSLVLRLSADEVLSLEGSSVAAAVAKGVGIVVLNGGDESGGRLYEAACNLRSVIGDRAYLLIEERVDIAAAVGANGVVLSDNGLPSIVARNMLMRSKPDSVYLPLVGRNVQNLNSALSAASSEGADFLIMSTTGENYARVVDNPTIQHVKVPIFFAIVDLTKTLFVNATSQLLHSGACGVVISSNDLKLFNDEFVKKLLSTAHVTDRILQDGYPDSSRLGTRNVGITVNDKKDTAGFTKLDEKEIQLIEAETRFLHEGIAVIRKAAPMMEEVSLLVDAAARLSEPFLLVIVGEFNSGKSTVINALLGRRYLRDGVIPTTNEIMVLCYSDTKSTEQERCERHPDGQFICYLSAPILRNMNLVDTPGTNVILQRQQRLTEEFVPRADLIIFVISSDRPLSESEGIKMLEIFGLFNITSNCKKALDPTDFPVSIVCIKLEEATTFIKENTWKLLGTEDVRLFPVSARSALEAKISASANVGRDYEEVLYNDPRWISSRFYELEKFLFSFMDGSTDTGVERMKLKLETPIGIADRLLSSCERLLKQEYEDVNQDMISIKEIVSSVKEYIIKMETESVSWRKQTLSLIESAKERSINLIESILRLSNIDLIGTYAFKGERSGSIPSTSAVQNEIISPTISDLQRLLEGYAVWLESTNVREGKLYIERMSKSCHVFVNHKYGVQSEPYELVGKGEELSLMVVKNFNAVAAARLFEQEIREAVLGTFGGLGAAGLSASLLTTVLPTTLEDLLALAVCSVGGFVTISNFAIRRKEAVDKVRKVADGMAREIEEAMQKDLVRSTENLKLFVEAISKPYLDAAQQRIDRVLETQDMLTNIERKLQQLKVEIQNLGAITPDDAHGIR